MYIERFEQQVESLFSGIALCINSGQLMPALVLAYTTIEIIADAYSDVDASGPKFRMWADRYIDLGALGCTSDDLWGARCAIIHTLSPTSRLSESGKARRIMYAYGKAGDVGLLRRVIEERGENWVAVKIEDLAVAIHDGMAQFKQDWTRDEHLRSKVEKKARQLLANVPATRPMPSETSGDTQ